MNQRYTFYDVATGLLGAMKIQCPSRMLKANTPAGYKAIEGEFDHLSQRVDLATGQVVDWQPPAPADDAFTTHTWDPTLKRWRSQPTAAAIERDRRAALVAQMVAVEAQQARPTRELVLDPANKHALAKLQQLDQQLERLRWQLNAPPPPT